MKLRETQQKILDYHGGLMAVSAVPGSGKTFILSQLAARLLAQGKIDVDSGQKVLIVTYLNSSVENFKANIRQTLSALGINSNGFDVRTLHSLALEIVRLSWGSADSPQNELSVCDEIDSRNFISLAVSTWIESNNELWSSLIYDSNPQERVKWQSRLEDISQQFIKECKNYRYTPSDVTERLKLDKSAASQAIESLSAIADEPGVYQTLEIPLLGILSEVYSNYQFALSRQSTMDFDDLIWEAAKVVEYDNESASALQLRWPFILEDEAQDSVPLQEHLLDLIAGVGGNWVRVGDPNQAITSSFTTAHPRQFNCFLDRSDVKSFPLPHSGRNAPIILMVANELVRWVGSEHPVPEVQKSAFRQQKILPTPPGDTQPNPPDSEASIEIRVFGSREGDELPKTAEAAWNYAQEFDQQTIAVLVPTNRMGYLMAEQFDSLGADYDNQLKRGNEIRGVAAILSTVLGLLVNPADRKSLANVYTALTEIEHPAVTPAPEFAQNIRPLLLSVYKPESFIFSSGKDELSESLPASIAGDEEVSFLHGYAEFLRSLVQLRNLVFDDLILTLSDELFLPPDRRPDNATISDLNIAYQLAEAARSWLDHHSEWRLPEVAAQMNDVARGRYSINVTVGDPSGYKPEPGRITLSTQHGAKGMEWDVVFLLGIDGSWIPGSLDANFYGDRLPSGGKPSAEAISLLHTLMDGASGSFPGRSATESADIELICERLRLLYVGLTRARRRLFISRSSRTQQGIREVQLEPVMALGAIYRFSRDYQSTLLNS